LLEHEKSNAGFEWIWQQHTRDFSGKKKLLVSACVHICPNGLEEDNSSKAQFCKTVHKRNKLDVNCITCDKKQSVLVR